MARHSAPKSPRRTLLQAGLTVTAVGAALSAGAGAAQAAPAAGPAALAVAPVALPAFEEEGPTPGQALTGALQYATAGGIGPTTSMRLNPLAGTAVDPLDNTIGTQVADFQPVTTGAATGSLTKGAALKDLPVVGAVTGALPG
ncbi:hypothetical protein [Streptomyces sp. NPDC048442]|uniref:hypothetical protein n=1 Tax=Streptomyces sp. NPDC048442 TaxID=3154823 RepID=UPI003417638C